MIYGKDFKNPVNKRHPRSTPRDHWWLRAGLLAAGVSIIGVVLAKSHDRLDPAQDSTVFDELVSEALTLPGDTEAVAASPAAEDVLTETGWIERRIRPGDTLSSIFSELSVHSALGAVLAQPLARKHLHRIHPGQTLRLRREQGRLSELLYHPSATQALHLVRDGEGFRAELKPVAVERRVLTAHGTITDSLFNSGKRAGLSDNLVMQLFNIFAYDIDFALDIREGDQFTVIYEERFANGHKLKGSPVLAAEFINRGKVYRAIRFTDAAGHSDYYNPQGRSLRKAFIRTPVKFTRISSHFNLRRMHPILHRIRAHKGVDYAAPRGTPVKATGNGRVIFAGRKGGYGNVVIIQHGKRYSTLYAHLSRFRKGIRKGARVKQGQVIAYVGATGRATGPHLHYEFRVNGVHKNPLSVRLPKAEPLRGKALQTFRRQAAPLLAQLEAQHRIARND